MEKKEEIKKEEQTRYEKKEVPENYKLVVMDNKEKIVYEDLMDILTLILNKIEKIERSVA